MIRVTDWEEIQRNIRECDVCRNHQRVAPMIRQRTPPPTIPVSLLIVGLAPPHEESVTAPKVANSATNSSFDKLRLFVEDALARSWDELTAKGLFLIHAVKCAIVPNADDSQNPPLDVVDCCNPVGFAHEFQTLRAAHVVTLGDMGRRAVLKTPTVSVSARVTLTAKLGQLQQLWPDGIPCSIAGTPFILHPARFPRTTKLKREAVPVIRKAAQFASLTDVA